jgi:hypothetical protein
MTVERGAEWGRREPVPSDLVVLADSANAVALIAEHRRRDLPIPPIGLLAGDLVKTLGGPATPDLERAHNALHVTVDLGVALCDGHLQFFLDHVVVRKSWLRGPLLTVCNAAFLGSWNIAPRAHPGDGKLDFLETSTMSTGDRWKARHRLPSGTHVPHPDIRQWRSRAEQFSLDTSLNARVDGRPLGQVKNLSVRIEPDAVSLWI